jgi:hypothetical protein
MWCIEVAAGAFPIFLIVVSGQIGTNGRFGGSLFDPRSDMVAARGEDFAVLKPPG